jgi:hypothetical protein
MIYVGHMCHGTVLWICGNLFLDLLLLSMKFYMLHFTDFIFNCIFTTKNTTDHMI